MWRWLLVGLLPMGCFVPDSVVDAYVDRDGDGFPTVRGGHGTDCDDSRADVHPAHPEKCDERDNDCDGSVDNEALDAVPWFLDGDGDGYPGGMPVLACDAPTPLASRTSRDCDDRASGVYPGAVDVCGDGLDNDCNGDVDDGDDVVSWWPDVDGDGFGHSSDEPVRECAAPDHHSLVDGDCDDEDEHVFPGAIDRLYNGVDEDCAGDDDFDRDQDGFRVDPDTVEITDPNYVPDLSALDCDDTRADVHPHAVDVPYDGVDADCRGDDDFDVDGDGHATPAGGGADCDDGDSQRHPGAEDVPYDGFDADCDPSNDDDLDGDGVGHVSLGGDDCDDSNPNVWSSCPNCADLDGDGAWSGCDAYVTVEFDCDDTDSERHPTALEAPGDAEDSNCDGRDFWMNESTGVFVSELGADVAGCGEASNPCGTLGYADSIATSVGKALFVAGGTYEGTTVHTSVHGGFDPSSWVYQPESTPTVITVPRLGTGREVGLDATSDGSLALTDLQIVAVGRFEDVDLVRASAGTLWIRGLVVLGSGIEQYCRGLSLAGERILVEASEIVDCRARLSIGVEVHSLAPSETAPVRVVDSVVRSGWELSDGGTTAMWLHERALVAEGSSFQATGRPIVYGIFVDGGDHETVDATVLRDSIVRVSSVEADTAMAVRVQGRVELVRTLVEADDASAVVASTADLRGVVLRNVGGASALSVGTGDSRVLSTTIQGSSEIGMAVAEAGHVTVENSVVQATGSGLRGGSYSLERVVLDASCPVPGCLQQSVDACNWPGCVLSAGVVVGNAELVDSGLPVDGGVCHDAGALPLGIDPGELDPDLFGTPRPSGLTWDIGAVERPD